VQVQRFAHRVTRGVKLRADLPAEHHDAAAVVLVALVVESAFGEDLSPYVFEKRQGSTDRKAAAVVITASKDVALAHFGSDLVYRWAITPESLIVPIVEPDPAAGPFATRLAAGDAAKHDHDVLTQGHRNVALTFLKARARRRH